MSGRVLPINRPGPLGLLLALALIAIAPQVWAAAPVFEAKGFNPYREFFGQLPNENVNPLNGNLVLTATDLVLPGNAGFELSIQRVYNSKIYSSYEVTFGGSGWVPTGWSLGADSWAGLGWTLHLGRVTGYDPPGTPTIEMPDGSAHATYVHPTLLNTYITTEYWLYEKNPQNGHRLSLPNGTVYTFNYFLGGAAYVTRIEDPFGNVVNVSYFSQNPASPDYGPADGIRLIEQVLSPSQKRVIRFTTDRTTRLALSAMTLETGTSSRTWTYVQDAAPTDTRYSLLREVRPPDCAASPNSCASWKYLYQPSDARPPYELSKVTTPSGGELAYKYGNVLAYGGAPSIPSRPIIEKQIGGRDVAAGLWTYQYGQGGAGVQTVIAGGGTTTTYEYSSDTYNPNLDAYVFGIQRGKSVADASGTLQSETHDWLFSQPIAFPSGTQGGIKKLLLDRTTVTRAGKQYVTQNYYKTADLNDYGRPWKTVETGDYPGGLSRETVRTFDYDFVPYIKDRTKSETVTVGSESFTNTLEYDRQTGFKKADIVYGVRTEYEPLANGNLRTSRDANGVPTSFEYDWGVLRKTDTPEYTITRVINPEGTIESETRRGFTTRFQYDGLFRPTSRQPAIGNATTITYDNTAGQTVEVARGLSRVTTQLDGFGRVSGTFNTVPVKTDVTYDAQGRRTYESHPFTASADNKGATFEYDGLNRLKRKTNADGTYVLFTYNGIDVEIRDEEGRKTNQDWAAFGDPGEARLMKVTDALLKPTAYVYNALGKLTDVDGGGPDRSWRFNTKNQLLYETHPETGRVDYTYDPAGNLKTREDGQFRPFGKTVFSYDGNNRLIGIDHPTPYDAHDTTIEYDASDNRTLLRNGYVSSTFDYDSVNRLKSRTDVVKGQTAAAGQTVTTIYGYDGNDNLRQIDYPSANVVKYTPDDENRIVSVTSGSNVPFANQFTYHPSGAVASFKPGGTNAVQTFAYDPFTYRLKDVGTGALSLQYTYDDVGNVKAINEPQRPGMNAVFDYDDLDRLTVASGSWGSGTYSYNDQGNRLTKTVGGSVTYTYFAASDRLESAAGQSFSYDANGNTTFDGRATYVHTPSNLVEVATAGEGTTTYRYDGDNLRKMKLGPGGDRIFVHGVGNQILSEFEQSCTGALQPVRDYVYAGSRLIAAVKPSVNEVSLALVSTSATVPEGVGIHSFQVRLTTSNGSATQCPVTVRYSTATGTATEGADFTAASNTISFAAGASSGATQSISVSILNDGLDEDDETFTVGLMDEKGAAVEGLRSYRVTLTDDDPTPTVSIADATVTEGNSGSVDAQFVVSLSAVSGRTITLGYGAENDTATGVVPNRDYLYTTGTLTIAAGAANSTILIPVYGDTLDEADESFLMSLSSSVNAIIDDGNARGVIVDDDAAPGLSVSDVTVSEGNGSVAATFVVSLAAASGRAVRVDFATADGTAQALSDYVPRSGRLTLPPGVTSQVVTVTVIGDLETEGAETLFLRLSNPSSATLLDGEGAATIKETPKLTSPPPGSTLGTSATFAWATQAGIGEYWLSVGTGPGRSDLYHASQATALSAAVSGLPGGATTVYVRLWFREGSAWTFNDYRYGGPLPTLAMSRGDVLEGPTGSRQAALAASLSYASTSDLSVSFATSDGSATSGPDYAAATGTITLAAGQTTRVVTVSVNGDSAAEGDETVSVDLNAPVGAIVAEGRGTLSIVDDDMTGARVGVSRTSAVPGQPMTVTIENGAGYPADWVTLAATSDPDRTYRSWQYLNGQTTTPAIGTNSASLVFVMPTIPGTYEFRLLTNNGYTRQATSPPVTVATSSGGVLDATPASLEFGPVKVGGAPLDKGVVIKNLGGGSITDSASVSGAGFSIVSANPFSLPPGQQTTVTVRFAPGSVAVASGFLALSDGGRVPVRGEGILGASLSVYVPLRQPSQAVSVTVGNSPGNTTDWIGMYSEGAVDTANASNWVYLNGTKTAPATGMTSATVSFTLPSAAGKYEFRLFASNGYTKLATSGKVSVEARPVLEVTPSSLSFGSVTVGSLADRAVTVKNVGTGTLTGAASVSGPGFSVAGSGTYSLGATQTAILTVRFSPTVQGPASGTLTLPGGDGATVPLSGTGSLPPGLSVSKTTAAPGETITVTVANGPGNTTDWVGLYATATADGSPYVSWQYLNGLQALPATGLTSATLSFTMPTTLGTYNFRLYANSTSNKLATSPTVTVEPPSNPTIEATPSSLAFGSVAVGTSKDMAVTVKNAGGGTLSGAGSVTGSGFSLVGTSTYALTFGQTVTLTVRYSPTAEGAASGTLTLTGGAGASVGLSGTGTPAPTLTVNATTAGPGGSITVTVANGPGNKTDWVGLHATGAADTVYVGWKFLNGLQTAPSVGVTSATLTFVMPTTAGTYNFRFFANGGYTKLATSPTVTVSTTPALQVTPTSLAFGSVTVGSTLTKTVTVKNVGGGTLTGAGSISGSGFSVVGTSTYSLTANQTAILSVRFAPTIEGSATGTLTLTGGAGASVPLGGTGSPSPTLTVDKTSATPGETVAVTVANGPGNTTEWVGLYATSTVDGGPYFTWQYLNGLQTLPTTGLTSATLTFTMPTTLGTYNFRLYANSTANKLATSPTVTVAASTTPVMNVTPSSLGFGSVSVGSSKDMTVTVKNTGAGTLTGSGTVSGTGYSLAGPNTYSLTANQTATLTVRFLPTAEGAATGTLSLTGAAGAAVALSGTGVGPSLSVSTTTVAPGGTVTVTVANGPANPRDWVGLHAVSAANNVYVTWKYLNGLQSSPPTGLSGATLTFTMPTTGGNYNFRLFANDGLTRLATSPTVTVQ